MSRDPRLDAQMAECRELLAEVRGATKDLRVAIKDSQDAYKGLLMQHAEPYLKTEMESLGRTLKVETDRATALMFKKFERLTNLLQYGNAQGRGPELLEDAVKQLAERWHAP